VAFLLHREEAGRDVEQVFDADELLELRMFGVLRMHQDARAERRVRVAIVGIDGRFGFAVLAEGLEEAHLHLDQRLVAARPRREPVDALMMIDVQAPAELAGARFAGTIPIDGDAETRVATELIPCHHLSWFENHSDGHGNILLSPQAGCLRAFL
jgi:hypothetical protein